LYVQDIGDLLMYADFFRKGLPPVSGGVLDQSAGFITACEIIWNLQDYYKHKQLAFDF
jgi:hypothetical protein